MLIHDENLPRGLWRLGRIKELIVGGDGNIRSAVVRVASQGQRPTVVNRPIQRLYPLEFNNQEMSDTSSPDVEPTHAPTDTTSDDVLRQDSVQRARRPQREAFNRAQDRLQTWCQDLNQTDSV